MTNEIGIECLRIKRMGHRVRNVHRVNKCNECSDYCNLRIRTVYEFFYRKKNEKIEIKSLNVDSI